MKYKKPQIVYEETEMLLTRDLLSSLYRSSYRFTTTRATVFSDISACGVLYRYSIISHKSILSQKREMSTGLRTKQRELMMIRPVGFGVNVETAASNVYQGSLVNVSDQEARVMATAEFDTLVNKLRENNIQVRIFEDTPLPSKPDAVFPNNWISFHEEKKIVLYPMFAKLRRTERREDIVQELTEQFGYEVVDYTHFEKQAKYLEGTGSMVLDRTNKIAYACKSVRTHPEVLEGFCKDFGYTPVIFEAQYKNVPIYHTNVMMSVAEEFVVICTDCIIDKHHVTNSLKGTNKHIVNLSIEQVANFCGNALPVYDKNGAGYLVMSTRAFNALTTSQVMDIEQYCKIIHSPIPITETLGGGSVRCMLAEVF